MRKRDQVRVMLKAIDWFNRTYTIPPNFLGSTKTLKNLLVHLGATEDLAEAYINFFGVNIDEVLIDLNMEPIAATTKAKKKK